MPTLSITDFCCLKEATFELASVNVIIGPQGSGKSVTTKLLYFFVDILNNHVQTAERGDSIEDYKRQIAKQFSIWFPPSAWGQGRFIINYLAGSFTVRIIRRMSKGRLSDNVSVTFSEWFTAFYDSTADLLREARTRAGGDDNLSPGVPVSDAIDQMWRVRELISRKLSSDLRDNYVARQTFIPAGRAFFTSIGRLVAGFEQAGSLDPITIKFARLFANLRDRYSRHYSRAINQQNVEFAEKRQNFMTKLFGGEIKYEDDSEFVETSDGRKIPFSSLSSGQQELLPMWSLIDYFVEIDSFRSKNNRRNSLNYSELVYIEEPEAHLFPSAQSQLMEFLIGNMMSEKSQRSLILTTHSPYIMSKLNVFLKAGQLARRKKRNQDINDVVPRDCWLTESQLAAFALEGGKLRTILEPDGLIDGRYLDEISEQIAQEFSQLIQIESEI